MGTKTTLAKNSTAANNQTHYVYGVIPANNVALETILVTTSR